MTIIFTHGLYISSRNHHIRNPPSLITFPNFLWAIMVDYITGMHSEIYDTIPVT